MNYSRHLALPWQFQIFNALLSSNFSILTVDTNLGSIKGRVFPKDFLLIIEILFINTQPLLLQKLQGGISQFAIKNWGYLIPELRKQLSMYLSLIDWVETKWLLHFIEEWSLNVSMFSWVTPWSHSWYMTALMEIKFSCTHFDHKWSGLKTLWEIHQSSHNKSSCFLIVSKFWMKLEFPLTFFFCRVCICLELRDRES